MPIYVGTSTTNLAQIVTANKQMQKVYVGDKLVWSKNTIIPVRGGLFYNWFAATDARNIANTGWRVPSLLDATPLSSYCKELADSSGWQSYATVGSVGNDQASNNTAKFNFRPVTSIRDSDGADWSNTLFSWGAGTDARFQITDNLVSQYNYSYNFLISYVSSSSILNGSLTKNGACSIRLLKDSTTLSNGQSGIYIGNNGKIYRTICIGSQEWLADNLCETKYRNGDPVQESLNGACWATGSIYNLTPIPLMCAPSNTWSNVSDDYETLTIERNLVLPATKYAFRLSQVNVNILPTYITTSRAVLTLTGKTANLIVT